MLCIYIYVNNILNFIRIYLLLPFSVSALIRAHPSLAAAAPPRGPRGGGHRVLAPTNPR